VKSIYHARVCGAVAVVNDGVIATVQSANANVMYSTVQFDLQLLRFA